MYYYHLRYNLYGGAGFAVEEERWLEFTEQLDDTQVAPPGSRTPAAGYDHSLKKHFI